MNTGANLDLPLVERYFRDTADYWSDVYDEPTLNGERYRARARAVLDLVAASGHAPRGTRILEIGCGAGRTAVSLARQGFSVEALDVVPAMVEQVRRRAADAKVSDRLRAATGDVNCLPFEAGAFDMVLAIGVLEWSPTLSGPLSEMARVLRPGGHLIVNVDNARALHCLFDPRFHPLVTGAKRLLRRTLVGAGLVNSEARPGRCTPKKLDDALNAAGMRKTHGLTCGFGPYTFLGFRLLPGKLGLRLHFALQRLAGRGTTGVRLGGETYLTCSERQ